MRDNSEIKARSACSLLLNSVAGILVCAKGCHSFPAEFVCHTRSWLRKSDRLILQLVLILAWGVSAPLGSHIRYILRVRKWLFMLRYCMKCLIIHSWKLAECDYSLTYINSRWCFTAFPQENKILVQKVCRELLQSSGSIPSGKWTKLSCLHIY